MKVFSVIGLVLFQEVRPTTGNPLFDAAVHFGGLAILCLALWIMLGKQEKRYTALALGYKEEVTQSATVRAEMRDALRGLRDETRIFREQQAKANEALMREIEKCVRRG